MATQLPDSSPAVGNAPSTSGMMVPQKPEGDFASAKLDALNAMRLLDRAIARVGPGSKEGKSMLKARATLTEEFGGEEEETATFSHAELKRMIQTLAGPGETPKPPPPQMPGGGGAPGQPPGQPPPEGGQPPGMPGEQ